MATAEPLVGGLPQLELALNTFRYVDGVKHVAVFLPPPPVTDMTKARPAQTSVFLTRGDVADQLRRPLSTTLGNRTPAVGEIPPTEVCGSRRSPGIAPTPSSTPTSRRTTACSPCSRQP